MSFIDCAILGFVIGIVIGITQYFDNKKNKFSSIEDLLFRPEIHYKRGTEGDAEYLRKICPADSAAAKDRLQILLDFVYWDENYFLLKADDEKLYLRKYSTRSASDGIFINEFGELEPGDDPDGDPNQRGSEAWWREQKKFIDESLYVNHDWDIFKREEARCDAEHCHDPYHHHAF